MLPKSLSLFSRVRKQLFSLSVLGVMVAIGVWGHKSHWQFSSHAKAHVPEHGAQGANEPPTVVVKTDGASASADPSSPPAAEIKFPTPESVGKFGIRCGTPQHQPMVSKITAAGVVTYEPTRLAQLSARVAGTVWRVEKQVGQSIAAGDVLAIIDAPAVGQAKADFLHAMADVQLCQRAYERLQRFAQGEVPAKQIQEAETALRKARVDLFNSQQALISLGLPIDLDEWQGLSEDELQRRIKFLGLPEGDMSQLDPNSTTATLLPLRAPFGGEVIGRDLAKGEIVSPQQSFFEIADVRKMWVVINIREQDIDKVELGQRLDFTTGTITVAGTISWMSTSVDERTRTVEVRAEVDNPEQDGADGKLTGKRLLRANLFGVGTIHVRENPNALVLPTKAVQRVGTQPMIFVQGDEQTFLARPVTVGVVTAEFSEIISGLAPDERVVVEGSHILKAEVQRTAAGQTP